MVGWNANNVAMGAANALAEKRGWDHDVMS